MKNKNKISIILLCCFIVFFVGYFIIKETYSTGKSLNEAFINTNIDKLNSILKTKFDFNNPYYLTKITDDNGNVPAYSYYSDVGSKGIRTIKAYDNKLFLGLGDYDKNTGPVKIIYYDTLTDKIVSSGTLHDEEVKEFVIIDNKLYTVGTDPRDSWEYGSYYTYNNSTNLWDKYTFNNGWIHVFDIEEYNDKIFMCGSVVATTEKSLIQVSFDNGESFEDVKVFYSDGNLITLNNELRAYSFFVYKNELYARIYQSSSVYNGIYKYDEANNEFRFIQNTLPLTYPFHDDNGKTINAYPAFERYLYVKTLNFNNSDLYISGQYLYSLYDLITKQIGFEIINIDEEYAIQNGVVYEDLLYLLSYRFNDDNSFDVRIYKTKDLKTFDIVYEFTTDSFPYSIECYNNNIYIGTTLVDYVKDTASVGTLYKLSLDKFERELILNDNDTISVINGDVEYTTSYELNPLNTTFQVTLSFNDNMTKSEIEEEFNKLKNMNLLYTLSSDREDINYNNSITYFNNILNNNIDVSFEYSNASQFYNSIFGNNLDIQTSRFSLVSEDISSNGEYKTKITLVVNNINDKITSEKYKVDETKNFVYTGIDNNFEDIKSNINYSDNINVVFENDKLLLKLENEVIREYLVIGINTDLNIIDNTIFTAGLSEQEILSKINITNGKYSVINDKILQINYDGMKVDEYKLIRISYSDFSLIDNDKLYVSNKKSSDIEKSINVTNSKVFVSDDKITITTDSSIVKNIDLLSINLGNLNEKDKCIIIPGSMSFNEFTKNIVVDDGIVFKIMDNTSEITGGNISTGMKLKVYYSDKEVDSFDIIDEYLSFSKDINIDIENRILSNINFNKNVSEFLRKINTSGNITVMNNRDEVLNNNSLVGTGSRVTINLSKDNYDYLLMIKGDINGDGLLSLDDINVISDYLYKNKNSLTGIYLDAADYDNNSSYNLEDIMKIAYKMNNNVTLNTLADKIVNMYNTSDETTEVVVGNVTYKLDTKNKLISDIDGNIRYYGKEPDNYVYFNCDKYPSETCEVWRIVGVFDGKVKLVKNNSLGSLSYDFNYNDDLSSKTYNNNWHSSSIKNLLNGAYLNNEDTIYYNYDYKNDIISQVALNFKTDHTGIKENTIDYISNFKYNAGNWYYNDKFMYADEIYNYEKGFGVYDGLYYNTTWIGKIAFANTSDYMYSADFTKCTLSFYEYDNTICSVENWMTPVLAVDFAGWSLNGVTNRDTSMFVFYQVTGGYATARVTSIIPVVPVLHLKEDIKVIADGDGSVVNPYKLLID